MIEEVEQYVLQNKNALANITLKRYNTKVK